MIKKRIATGSLLMLFAILSLSSAIKKSATWDETHYLGVGLYLWENSQWDIPSAMLHPPLQYYLNSLPLVFCDIDRSCFEKGKTPDLIAGIRRGQCLLKNSNPSGDKLLFFSRFPTILLGVLLGYFVFNWSQKLFGTGGAFISLFLYCLSPNILAHTRLITPDLALTAFGFITAYYFWQNLRNPSIKHMSLSGLFLGLTLLSKYSGLFWIPVMAFISVLVAVFKPVELFNSFEKKSNKRPIVDMAIIFIIAYLIVLFGYQLQISNYINGILAQKMIVGEGFPAFLNGVISRNGGWWYYYILAFIIKTPIPMLILIGCSMIVLICRRPIDRISSLLLLLPILVFVLIFSISNEINVGLRYILPCFPFFMVLAGILSGRGLNKKKFRIFLIVPLLLWYMFESISIYPHYLSYFNQFICGPKNGYKYLLDSNLDWGQDLKGLKTYMEKKGIEKVKLSYFGTSDPDQYGIQYDTLPSFVIFNKQDVCQGLEKGDILAISATNLYPLYVDLGELGSYLRRVSPVDRIGYSIYIYSLDESISLE